MNLRIVAAIIGLMVATGTHAQTGGGYPTIPYNQIQTTDSILLQSNRFTLPVFTTLPIIQQWIIANGGAGAPITGFTPNLPFIGSVSGGLAQGTVSGTTTKFAVVDGTTTSGQCAVYDSTGGLTSVACSPSGSGTVGAGLVGQLPVYNASTGIVGTTTGTGVVSAVASAVNTAGGLATYANVGTEAALVALAAGVVPSIHMQGYYNQGDGGEGNFDWKASCPQTPDSGVYIAPGAGGGGCWQREATGARANIRWWGAHCDYNGTSGTDDSAIINTAIAWVGSISAQSAAPASGGTLWFPRGCSEAISDTVWNSYSGVTVSGESPPGLAAGTTGVPNCSAYLSPNPGWTAGLPLAAAGPTATQYGAGYYPLAGANFQNMCFYGAGLANTGLTVASEFGCSIHDLFFSDFKFNPMYITVAEIYNGGHALAADDNVQACEFRNIYIDETSISGSNPAGLILEGYKGAGNPSLNHFNNLKFDGNCSYDIISYGSDSNTWTQINNYQSGGSSCNMMWLTSSRTGPGAAYAANDEIFYGINTNGSHIILDSNTTLNLFLPIETSNGGPAPSCHDGSVHASWLFTGGTTFGSC